MNNRNLQIVAVFLPLLLMVTWVAKLYLYGVLGTNIMLKITGYDPRSLLSGHYLLYRVDYGIENNNLCSFPAGIASYYTQKREGFNTKCICLEPPPPNVTTGTISKVFWAGSCAERPNNCPIYLEGTCATGRFISVPERYYFPEALKKQLNTVPENAHVIVNVFRGKAQVKGIEVNGTNILK